MKVFISYSHADEAFVQRLRDTMESLGATVEDPGLGDSSGSEWASAIRSSLERADAVFLVVPEAGTRGANNAFFEAGVAHALGKQVLAVVPEQRSSRLREFPSDLVGFAVMDASNKPLDTVAKTLLHAIEPA